MKQYIDKSALIAEIKRITDEQQEICKADVAFGKAPDSKNIEVIYQFQQFTKFLDTLEVKEIGVDIGSPEDDYNSKTIQCLLDKLNRLIACMGKEDEMQINESIEDTLTDLACYSVMTLSYLRRKKK